MSRKRFFGVFFGIVGAVLLAVVLYVAFADLGRHKARIEAFVTKTIGRPFVIEGPFKLTLVPVLELSAERVRLGNMPGGSEPQMVEVGKVAVKVGFWSLISGPPDVHSIELRDTTVLLEKGPDGKGNWIMGATDEDAADITGELCNMLAGRVAATLASAGYFSTLSIPTVAWGRRLKCENAPGAKTYWSNWTCEGHLLKVASQFSFRSR